jgi:hypothetical protein
MVEKLFQRAIQNVQLLVQPDVISWTLTADQSYSAKSAYEAQFFGRLVLPDLQLVWRTKTE